MYNFNNKKLRITYIHGPNTEVNEETIFEFKQNNNIVTASYFGGKVKQGYLIGVIKGDRLNHHYIQVNYDNDLNSGEGNSHIELTNDGKLRIVEEWEWKNKEGNGKSVMTEI